MRDGYLARWRGDEFDASPDGDEVRLYTDQPREDFDEIRPGRHRRIVSVDEVNELVYVRTLCTWRGEPFIVLGQHDGWLRVEYTGGRAPIARDLGLEEFDFGVYQGWVPLAEVGEVREQRI